MTQLNKARLNEVLTAITQARQEILKARKPPLAATWLATSHLAESLHLLSEFARAGSRWLDERAASLEARALEGGDQSDIAQLITKMLNRYPPQYARHLLLDQTLLDLRVMWHIHLQRIHQPELKPAIERLERIATNALQFAVDRQVLSGLPQVLVYLQKSPSIRIMPYANLALIGLPYWLKDIDKADSESLVLNDTLAIAHEVGHFVYFRGASTDQAGRKASIANIVKAFVQREFANPEYPNITRMLPRFDRDGVVKSTLSDNWQDASSIRVQDTMKRWSEEAFADTYTFLYAGIASVVSLMDVALDRTWRSSVTDLEDAHPSPYIRPRTLLALGEQRASRDECAMLAKDWHSRTVIAKFDRPTQLDTLFSAPAYSKDSIYSALEKLSSFCAQQVQPLPENPPGKAQRDFKIPSTRSSPDIAREWRTRVLDEMNPNGRDPRPPRAPIAASDWGSWIKRIADEYQALQLTYIPDRELVEWVCALSAGGWTEGPANGGNRPT
jgi:hypothetical protein